MTKKDTQVLWKVLTVIAVVVIVGVIAVFASQSEFFQGFTRLGLLQEGAPEGETFQLAEETIVTEVTAPALVEEAMLPDLLVSDPVIVKLVHGGERCRSGELFERHAILDLGSDAQISLVNMSQQRDGSWIATLQIRARNHNDVIQDFILGDKIELFALDNPSIIYFVEVVWLKDDHLNLAITKKDVTLAGMEVLDFTVSAPLIVKLVHSGERCKSGERYERKAILEFGNIAGGADAQIYLVDMSQEEAILQISDRTRDDVIKKVRSGDRIELLAHDKPSRYFVDVIFRDGYLHLSVVKE